MTGSICGDTFFDDAEANIICRQMNFTGGRRLQKPFGSENGSLFINSLRCHGNETKITDCQLLIDKSGDTVQADSGDNSLRSRSDWYGAYRRSSCWMGKEDAAVQCYTTGLNWLGCILATSTVIYFLVNNTLANQELAGWRERLRSHKCKTSHAVKTKSHCCYLVNSFQHFSAQLHLYVWLFFQLLL